MTQCMAPFQNNVTAMLQSAAYLMYRFWQDCGMVITEKMRQPIAVPAWLAYSKISQRTRAQTASVFNANENRYIQAIVEEHSWNHKAQGCIALFEELCKS